MSRTLTITLTDDEADRLDALALIRDTRRTKLCAEFVRTRIGRLPADERECVAELVKLRHAADARRRSNVIPLVRRRAAGGEQR